MNLPRTLTAAALLPSPGLEGATGADYPLPVKTPGDWMLVDYYRARTAALTINCLAEITWRLERPARLSGATMPRAS